MQTKSICTNEKLSKKVKFEEFSWTFDKKGSSIHGQKIRPSWNKQRNERAMEANFAYSAVQS